jgi:transcriptional regulator with XRE-family HTH domain
LPIYLKEWRKVRFLTQRELATAAGISHRSIVAIENGEVKEPHPGTLRNLAAALEIEPAQLYRQPSAFEEGSNQ